VKTLKFQIRQSNGQLDQVTVEGERALIGIGAHCEIRLPVDQGKVEHVRIDVVPGGLYATALAFDPQPTLNNIPFSQSPITPESILGIGTTQIHVVLVEQAGSSGSTKDPKKSSPLAMVGLVAIVGLGAFAVLKPEASSDSAGASKPPELWKSGAGAVVCPAQGGQAKSQGEQALLEADAYRERSTFSVSDGVVAVERYEFAAACLTAGADGEGAKYATEASQSLRADLDRRYRKERLRLKMHTTNEDWVSVRRSIRVLLDFTEKVDPPYAEWLKIQDREAAKKVTKSGKK